MGTACDSVGLGVSLDNDTQRFAVLFTMHDEGQDLDPLAFCLIDPEKAAVIGTRIIAAAQHAAQVQKEIDESEDPAAALADWVERFKAGLN